MSGNVPFSRYTQNTTTHVQISRIFTDHLMSHTHYRFVCMPFSWICDSPYLLPPYITDAAYLRFLEDVLRGLLEDVPLQVRRNILFQHYGAPHHFSLAVRDHLDQRFGQQWIGRGDTIAWPARSPDLSPLDYYLWVHMKSLIYETPLASVEDILARVMIAADVGGQRIGNRVCQNMIRKYRIYVDVARARWDHHRRVGGGLIEPLL